MLGNLFGMREQETEEHWVSISDVMAGLMVIFLFIAISYMLNVRLKADEIIVYKNEIESLLNAYKNLQLALYKELREEFEGTPNKKAQFRTEWQGYLDMETVSIRFKQPFLQGEATVSDTFKNILREFFPRYVAILTKPDYKNDIAEIRIEGHTSSEWFVQQSENDVRLPYAASHTSSSSEWFAQVTSDAAYINNMKLSQNRARNVLRYVLQIGQAEITQNRAWLKKKLIANGLSSSQLIPDLDVNRPRPTNLYHIVANETGIPEWVVETLSLQIDYQISNWSSSESLTSENIIKAVEAVETLSNCKPEALDRAVNLLMENKEDSRRVEFRVITKSEKLIDEIQQLMKRFNKSEVVN